MKKLLLPFLGALGITSLLQAQTDVINITNSGGADKIGVGTGSGTPLSSFDVFGSYGQKVTALAANITLDITHNTVVCNPTAGSFIVTLPAASGCAGRVYVIKRDASVTANTVTVAGGATIDGAASFVLNSPNQVIEVFSNGTEWKSRVGGLSGLSTLIPGNDIDFGTSSSPNSIDIEPILNSVHTITAPASNNLNLNPAPSGTYKVTVNTNSSGTTGVNEVFGVYDGSGLGTAKFYLTPSGRAVANDWYYSAGNTGWFNSAYGGGWYMNDNTAVKSYGSKDVRLVDNATTLVVDGLTSGGTYNSAASAATANIMYVNNSTGKVYSLPTINSGTLVTGATGIPSWAASTGTGVQGYWTRSGTTLYNTNQGDNVGIGTTGPLAPLDVNGISLFRSGSSSTGTGLTYQMRFGYANTDQYQNYIRTRHNAGVTVNNAFDFYTSDGTAAGVWPTNAVFGMTINGGNVGIGSLSPDHLLTLTKTHASATTYDMLKANFDANWGLRLVQNYVGAGDIKYELKQVYSGTTYDVLAFKTGNVGVGNTSPGAKFDVTGTAAVDYLRVDPQDITNEGGELQLIGAGVNGTLQVDNFAGNLRIHTLAAGKVFNILGGSGIQVNALGGSGNRLIQTDNNGLLSVSSYDPSAIHTGTGTANYLARWTSATNLGIGVTFDNGTNVGIGTNAPVDKLDIRDAMSVNEIKFRNVGGGDDSDPYRLRKYRSSSNVNELRLDLNDDADERFTIYGNSCVGSGCGEYSTNLYHWFRSDGNAYHSGNLNVGGTIYPGNSSTYLNVNGLEHPSGRIYLAGNLHIDSYGGNAIYMNHYSANNMYMVTGGGRVGVNTAGPGALFHVNGNTGPTHAIIGAGGSYYTDWVGGWGGGLASWDLCIASMKYTGLTARSDIRLKKEITSLETMNALDFINKLKPVSYRWIDERLPQHLNYGLIAQEVEKLMPDLVDTGIDSLQSKGLHYMDLIAILIQGMKEQQKEIERLKSSNSNSAEIAELKKMLLELEKKVNNK
jgi:hypothetical protein